MVTLGLLMLRLFWQFSLQPKLAILSESFARSWSDMAHFAFVFSIILTFYSVWGYTFFGGQVSGRVCS